MSTSINETLTMDNPFEESLLDGAQGVIGTDLPRVEGPLKVSGSATYSAEYPVEHLAYGYLVLSSEGVDTRQVSVKLLNLHQTQVYNRAQGQ
jgi:xanthine dehydrogenase YagR molybdenum-binding subunit